MTPNNFSAINDHTVFSSILNISILNYIILNIISVNYQINREMGVDINLRVLQKLGILDSFWNAD